MTPELDVAGLCGLSTGNSRYVVNLEIGNETEALRGNLKGKPITGRVQARGRPGDLMATGWANLFVMSDRMRTFLEHSGLTGWFAQEVSVGSGSVWMLGVEGKSGPSYSATQNPLPGLPRLGEFFDPADWDGSDFFCPANWKGFLITGRCASALRGANLRNLHIECGAFEPLPMSSRDIARR
jgi:hypothetical protein